MTGFIARPLDETTWPDFAALVERHNGVWGGCWCMAFHGPGRGAAQMHVVEWAPWAVIPSSYGCPVCTLLPTTAETSSGVINAQASIAAGGAPAASAARGAENAAIISAVDRLQAHIFLIIGPRLRVGFNAMAS